MSVYHVTDCQCQRDRDTITDVHFTLEAHRTQPEEESTIYISTIAMPNPLRERVLTLVALLEGEVTRLAIHTDAPYLLNGYSLDVTRDGIDWHILSGTFLFNYCHDNELTLRSELKAHVDQFSPNTIIALQAAMDSIASHVEQKTHIIKHSRPSLLTGCMAIALSSLGILMPL